MATAIREQILSNMETALSGLIPSNPTASSIRRVTRAQLPVRPVQVRPSIVIWTGIERKDEDNDTGTFCELEVHVHVHDKANVDIETEAAARIVEVVEALLADKHRGGVAFDTAEVENSIFASDITKPEFTVAMMFLVRYQHPHGNPDSLT